MLIIADELRDLLARTLSAAGSEEAEAAIVADHLVEAALRGHDSHGPGMLPAYVRNRRNGRLQANRHARQVGGLGAMAAFDGDMGYGQVVAREVTDWGIGAARQHGLALATLRNVHHVGRVGTYGEQACAAGMIALFFVNGLSGAPRVAPFGGGDARMATNPICIAVPHEAQPVVLDFATSRIALGKVRVAYNAGLPVPEGALIDSERRPTRDPGAIYGKGGGALLPFGDHKGSGLALICEILGGALSGGATAQHANAADPAIVNGLTAIFISPQHLVERSAFDEEIRALLAYLRESPPADGESPVLLAGDPERRIRGERLQNGIPIDSVTWQAICEAMQSVGAAASASG
ncbi:MAG TPA: malate/lactate/ureidoglycolate dehydrogenase [Roseomonas sp.]|nr:malate/lactate/ureidoglycolate dehydrogenase [Roseomonas sp.]